MPKEKTDGLISSMKSGVQVDILEKLRIQQKQQPQVQAPPQIFQL